MIFSNPIKFKKDDIYTVDSKAAIATDNEFVKLQCYSRGYEVSNAASIKIEVTADDTEDMTYIRESCRITDEKYRIATSQVKDGIKFAVTCSGDKSLFYALNFIFREISSGVLFLGEVEDYPLFEMRGYIEGFYGNPWTLEKRRDTMTLMAAHNMNTYFYAPKDDEYHRDKWNELYPFDELNNLKELLYVAKDNFVDFWFCIAPGLSMKYSSEDDYEALLKKLRQLFVNGVKNFGLLLDDIPENLQYSEDIEKFGSETVAAHIFLANRLNETLKSWDKDIKLAVCPLQYHGNGNEYFISKLGRGISPEVKLFWTGHNICSQEITVPEAVRFIDSTYHKPLYWDNFPVNDAEMYNEMHLGYISGRDPELFRYCEGLISNCMEYCECSKVALLTVADYLWNPLCYDSARSWDYALRTVVGEGWDSFKLFADNLLSSCLKVPNSQLLCEAIGNAAAAIRTGKESESIAQFMRYVERLKQTAALIERRKDEALFVELSKWSNKFLLLCDTLSLCCGYMTDFSKDKQTKIAKTLTQYLLMPEVLADFCFQDIASFISKM